ncbi:MAG: division/cell wall cluster transcriptional repressor MraZ [Planctomycetales bacterium]|nr:division/cell wall cluster transcriptional repressor MraZ [Planctomycetales bacterium]
MPAHEQLVHGESLCSIDERFRLAMPPELAGPLGLADGDCWLVKERPGALSLWPSSASEADQFAASLELVQQKMRLGRLRDRTEQLMVLGRLLSTRRAEVKVDGRHRLTLPKGFREFLGVEAGGQVYVVGAALCIEIWRPDAWIQYVEEHMPDFRKLFEELST